MMSRERKRKRWANYPTERWIKVKLPVKVSRHRGKVLTRWKR